MGTPPFHLAFEACPREPETVHLCDVSVLALFLYSCSMTATMASSPTISSSCPSMMSGVPENFV